MTENKTASSSSKDEIVREAQKWMQQHKDLVVESHNYASPRISSEIPDCSMPLTFDQYNYCHPAGTRILTLNENSNIIEEKNIEDIQTGDKVVSYDENKQELAFGEVLNTGNRKVSKTLLIETEDGNYLELTPEHPVYVENRGWIKAVDLSENDVLLRCD